jgi:cytochrome c peroxidase
MLHPLHSRTFLAGLCALCLVAAPAHAADRELAERARSIFGVLPAEASAEGRSLTQPQIDLGRALYHDARLSRSQEVSCNSCHILSRYGAGAEPISAARTGQLGARNAPSSYNAAFHLAQFWDGREPDVEAQARESALNPVEMAMPSPGHVVRVLKSIPGYAPMFRAAFPGDDDPITYDNMATAIGAFERRLVTPGRFDRFMQGELDALSPNEVAGLDLFITTGCITCHNGPTIGGSLYQKLGLVEPYATQDTGRFELTGKESDRYVFKVPALRNAAQTGPWFHDGSIQSLEEAVRIMARHQLGRLLDAAEVVKVSAFLRSLTGEIDTAYIARPELPESGPDTPRPARR